MAYSGPSDKYSDLEFQNSAAPARQAKAVTPSDTVDLAPFAKALYIGTTGNLVIIPAGDANTSGVAVTFNAVPVGWFPVQVRRVNSTSTTASNIVAVFD